MRIIIVISSQELVRNYLNSNALSSLAKKHDLYLLYKDTLTLQESSTLVFKEVSTFKAQDYLNISRLVQDLQMLRWKNKSSGFRYRIKRKFPPLKWEVIQIRDQIIGRIRMSEITFGNYFKRDKILSLVKIFLVCLYLSAVVVRKKLKKLILFAVSSRFIFPIAMRSLLFIRKKNTMISNYLLDNDFDLLLYPSSAYEPELIDIVNAARRFKVKSLMLVDNWDNLSSKTVISHKPDFIATWGDQSSTHAVEIQGFPRDRCFNLGTPRIDPYFFHKPFDADASLEFQYILVVGSSAPYDEAGLIYKLDDEVSQNPNIYGEVKILFRPHPLRTSLDRVALENLKSTLLDTSVQKYYLRAGNQNLDRIPLPPLDGYHQLIGNASIVVSGITSMMIEASIFNKKCLVMGFDEASNITNPAMMLSVYPHFQGIENLPNLKVCRDQESLIQEVRLHFQGITRLKDFSKEELSYFIYSDSKPYPERLLLLVESLESVKV